MEPKILTIDDDAVIRATVCASFRGHVCRVLQAASGPEGLALARRERPQLILLDFDMPGMSGGEVLVQLKTDPELRAIPVVMLTINSQRDIVKQILKLGVSDYVVKPFTKGSLVERISRVVPLKVRAEGGVVARRFEEPLRILVVEDKPAIVEQIRSSLSRTPWVVEGVAQGEDAVALCDRKVPDLILISLSLPGGFGFTLFQIFRSHGPTKDVPILGLVVKTAVSEQLRAQQLGFNGIITKPIDLAGLPAKITRTLKLDVSQHYFQRREDCLVMNLPAQLDGARAGQVWSLLREKICEEVDAGLQQTVIDCSAIQTLDETLIKLVVRLVEFCAESEIQFGLVGSEKLRLQCQALQETKDWEFAPSFEAARARFAGAKAVAARAELQAAETAGGESGTGVIPEQTAGVVGPKVD